MTRIGSIITPIALVAALAAPLLGSAAAAPAKWFNPGKVSPSTPASPPATTTLSPQDAKKLIIDGKAGDWKFVTTSTGSLKSGSKVRLGSDYSGHCLTYKSQDAGINLGHVADCSQTKGGENVAFEKSVGDTSGAELRFGDTVAMSMARDNDRAYVCYGVRDNGINLNWGKNDAECKARSGSKGNGAVQWKLMPVDGSSKKVGDVITLADRIVVHNIVEAQPLVKCARIYKVTYPPTWWAGDLKWKNTCMHHELVWTHKDFLRSLGEDPKALALSVVPQQYRSVLEKVF